MKKQKTQMPLREFTLEEVQRHLGVFMPGPDAPTYEEFEATVLKERKQRIAAALPTDYVAVPTVQQFGISRGLVWVIFGPEDPNFRHWYDCHLHRREVKIGIARDHADAFEREVAEDLASALSIGRRFRSDGSQK